MKILNEKISLSIRVQWRFVAPLLLDFKMFSKCSFLTSERTSKKLRNQATVQFGEVLHYGRNPQKVSTVQNTEVSRFKRFIYSKNYSGGPASVQNEEVSTLERCSHKEVLL